MRNGNLGFKTVASRMTRRELLARAGITGAALALGGAAWADGDGAPKIIVGSGAHKYEWIPDWLVPPDDIKWGDTQGVCQDSKGRIYVTHTVGAGSKKGDAILVYDQHGKFLTSWGERFRGGGHGIEVRKEHGKEYLYHCDTAHHQVVKTDLDGAMIWEKGLPAEAGVYKPGDPFTPTNIAFAPNGDFYVADGYGSNWIHQYSIKGDHIRTFGGTGEDPGKFHCCHGIWLDTRGSEPKLVVTDRESNRIQYLTMDGKPIEIVKEGIRRPCYFDIRDGVLVIADLAGVTTLLDPDNKVIEQLGDGASLGELRGHPRSEYIPGKFIHPHGGKYLHNGDIIIVEWMNDGRITLLKKMRA